MFEKGDSKFKGSRASSLESKGALHMKPFHGFLKALEGENAFYHYKRSSNRLYTSGTPARNTGSLSPRRSIAESERVTPGTSQVVHSARISELYHELNHYEKQIEEIHNQELRQELTTERISKDIMSYYQRPKSYRISQVDNLPAPRKRQKAASVYDKQSLLTPVERKAQQKSKPGVLIGGGMKVRGLENIEIDDFFVSSSARAEEKQKLKYLIEQARKEELQLAQERRDKAMKMILSSSNVRQSNGVYIEKFLKNLKKNKDRSARRNSVNIPSLLLQKIDPIPSETIESSVSPSKPVKVPASKEAREAEKKKKMLFFGKNIHFARQMRLEQFGPFASAKTSRANIKGIGSESIANDLAQSRTMALRSKKGIQLQSSKSGGALLQIPSYKSKIYRNPLKKQTYKITLTTMSTDYSQKQPDGKRNESRRKQRGLWNYGVEGGSSPERLQRASIPFSDFKEIETGSPGLNVATIKQLQKQLSEKAFRNGKVFRLHNFASNEQSLTKAERLLELCESPEPVSRQARQALRQQPQYLASTASINSKKRDKYILVQGKSKFQKLEEQKQYLETQRKWLRRQPSISSDDFKEALSSRCEGGRPSTQFDPDLAKLVVSTATDELNAGAKRNILTHIGVTSRELNI